MHQIRKNSGAPPRPLARGKRARANSSRWLDGALADLYRVANTIDARAIKAKLSEISPNISAAAGPPGSPEISPIGTRDSGVNFVIWPEHANDTLLVCCRQIRMHGQTEDALRGPFTYGKVAIFKPQVGKGPLQVQR